jgi:hypothetical protein
MPALLVASRFSVLASDDWLLAVAAGSWLLAAGRRFEDSTIPIQGFKD